MQNSRESTVIDQSRIEEVRKMGDLTFFEEVIELFCGHAVLLMEELREAIKNGNGSEIHRLAHTLKGASLSIGAMGLVPICQQIEDKGKAKELSDVESLMAQMEEIYQQTKTELLGLKPS